MDSQIRCARLIGYRINRLHRIGQQFQGIAFQFRLDRQHHIAPRFQQIACRLQRVGKHRHLIKTCRIRQLHKSKAVALGRFAFLLGCHRTCDFGNASPARPFGLLGYFRQRQHLLPFQRPHVIIQRMTRQIEPDCLMLLGQPFNRQPVIAERKARLGNVGPRFAEQGYLIGRFRLMDRR